jgi:uncharacterized protein YdbL (DUF1318 family)
MNWGATGRRRARPATGGDRVRKTSRGLDMLTIERLAIVTVIMVLSACVTVNVDFPATAAEDAADRIINEVYGREAPQPAPAGSGGSGQSFEIHDLGSSATPLLAALVDVLIAPVHAQAPDINIDTPAIAKLKELMKQRHAVLEPFYTAGAIGLDANGLITIRASQVIPIRVRNQVKQLIISENQDRNALYAEIAKASGHPDWEEKLRETFAQRWVANAASGWWFRDKSGNWQQN